MVPLYSGLRFLYEGVLISEVPLSVCHTKTHVFYNMWKSSFDPECNRERVCATCLPTVL